MPPNPFILESLYPIGGGFQEKSLCDENKRLSLIIATLPETAGIVLRVIVTIQLVRREKNMSHSSDFKKCEIGKRYGVRRD